MTAPGVQRFVWIASYPKSGNTWVRVFLTNYIRNQSAPADINKLQGPKVAARSLFDRYCAISAAELTPTEIDLHRPAIYRAMAAESSETLVAKVHDVYRFAVDGTPLFPPDVTLSSVYVVRDPRDVVVSMAHHRELTVDAAIDRLCERGAVIAPAGGRSFAQVPQVVGSWSEHVESWLNASMAPVAVRYEDLVADSHQAFGRVVAAVRLPVDQDRLSRAIRFSSLGELQWQESQRGFSGRLGPSPFFRRGQAGQWREDLSAAQIARIERHHGAVMAQLGYR